MEKADVRRRYSGTNQKRLVIEVPLLSQSQFGPLNQGPQAVEEKAGRRAGFQAAHSQPSDSTISTPVAPTRPSRTAGPLGNAP